ncbi:PAQR family membrane homeostasis protein TrhA [Marinigracilibium pacificum]|uniref:Hemolysin III family protein n=1 Tax=Marinigracilibium pacificum TaxID=2729599 RepID=A0A848IYW2_9BACT|nr:hemolysin III family protein [Marinigracilibium pacificum]
MKEDKTESATKNEEFLNTLSHGITAIVAIGGFIILIFFGIKSEKDWSLFGALFYGISLVLLYIFSSFYHGLKHEKAKYIFKILDHCGIYLLIAGTYTPVLLISIGGAKGWIYFIIQWSMAIIGIVIKIFFTGRFKLISTLMYAIMGWIIIFDIELLKSSLSEPAFKLLAAGGFAYTFGIIFYILDKKLKYAHFIWHLFVITGSLLHYIMMVKYILI